MAAATFGTVWIFSGRIAYPIPSEFTNKLPVTTSGCVINSMMGNSSNASTIESFAGSAALSTADITTQPTSSAPPRPPVADLYAISYIYLTAFGFCFGMAVGIIVSLLSGEFCLFF